MEGSFIGYIEESIKANWDRPALTDFKGVNCNYKDVARKVEKLHILLEAAGVERGDRVALCGRNSTNWGIAFLAVLTYGAVAVPILNDFRGEQVVNLVEHSGARLLFVGKVVWDGLRGRKLGEMEGLEGVVCMEDYSLHECRNERLREARERLNELFGRRFPNRFQPGDVHYRREEGEALAVINYTSGTTSFSKGVMLPYRSLLSNLEFAFEVFGRIPGEHVISMLPMAHMYGLSFEFLYEFASGAHVFFLTRQPSPQIIAEAFATIRPHLIIAVPLIIEKIIRKRVLPAVNRPMVRLLRRLPVARGQVKRAIRRRVEEALGGRFRELIIGGAALNREVEHFLHDIGLAYTVGYGMTECGPILSYEDWRTFREGSCGRTAPRMELRIDSPDPARVVGEIQARGENVMLGYYRNEEATRAAFTEDGWLRTGDLGLMDEEGNLFIKGRSKSMILGPSGQNIYPEEVEGELNNMPLVVESLVVEREGRLVALVFPDFEAAAAAGKRTREELEAAMEENRVEVNRRLPGYSQIARVEVYSEEFEKTPKRSIKRYLYQ